MAQNTIQHQGWIRLLPVCVLFACGLCVSLGAPEPQGGEVLPPPRPPLASPLAAHPWDMFNQGLSNQLGRLPKSDPSAAVNLYRQAAASEFIPAILNLGYANETGLGVSANPAEAAILYRKAADLGNGVAQYNLGRSYFLGINGMAFDLQLARRHLRAAAESGVVPAEHLLGLLAYDENHGADAVEFFSKAAAQGYVPSMHALGQVYQYGRGVAVDSARALQWYHRAASRDFVPSYYGLGSLYESVGTLQNSGLAAAQYRKGAERGHRESQYQLGCCYYAGRGVPEDLCEVMRWWTLAENAGLELASRARRQLLKLMPKSDLARADALVAAFSPVASTYSEAPVAEVALRESLSTGGSESRTSGTACFISELGHLLTSSRTVDSDSTRVEVFTTGGRQSVQPLRRQPVLGLALVQSGANSSGFRPLALQTNHAELIPGRVVFVAALVPAAAEGNVLQPVLTRVRIAKASGPGANPRQFTLETRLPLDAAGCAVVDSEGLLLGIVVDPAPQAGSNDGAVAVTARQISEFIRASGVEPTFGQSTANEGDVEPVAPSRVRSSLGFLTSVRNPAH